MLILPAHIPAAQILRSEGRPVLDGDCPDSLHPLRILFLNLMPQKEVTELDIARVLAIPDRHVQLLPMKIAGQTYKTTSMAYMRAFYSDFEEFEQDKYDGLIITGAPVEHLPFEDVRYWPQLCRIMDWARSHVRSTLYICWGAQAGLYYHYGIPKYPLPEKRFGVFGQRVLSGGLSLFKGMEPEFPMPNSRHTEVRRQDFPTDGSLCIVAESEESGIGVVMSPDGHEIFIVGHLEYEPQTLHNEYRRDLGKGLSILPPLHYYRNDCPEQGVNFSWEQAARLFYSNWLDMFDMLSLECRIL